MFRAVVGAAMEEPHASRPRFGVGGGAGAVMMGVSGVIPVLLPSMRTPELGVRCLLALS